MDRADYRILVDRGRRAGLGTSELYRAMSARRPDDGGREVVQADGNGFVADFDGAGHRIYRPFKARVRPD